MVIHVYKKGTTDDEGGDRYLEVLKASIFLDEPHYEKVLRIRHGNPSRVTNIPLDQIRWWFVEGD